MGHPAAWRRSVESTKPRRHRFVRELRGRSGKALQLRVRNLRELDSRIRKALIVVTIHDAETAGNNFSHVNNAYVRLLDDRSGKEILRYSLTEKFSTETALEFAEFQQDDGSWRFQALGQGSNQGLADFVNLYA